MREKNKIYFPPFISNGTEGSRRKGKANNWTRREVTDLKQGVLQQYQQHLLNLFFSSNLGWLYSLLSALNRAFFGAFSPCKMLHLDSTLSEVALEKKRIGRLSLSEVDEEKWTPDWREMSCISLFILAGSRDWMRWLFRCLSCSVSLFCLSTFFPVFFLIPNIFHFIISLHFKRILI